MNEGELLQFDTPLNLLRNPSGDFVREFVGAQKIMKALPLMTIADLPDELLRLIREEDISEKGSTAVSISSDLQSVLEAFLTSEESSVSITDESNNPIGTLCFSTFRKYLSGFIT
jgi:osmoprotectant transport system ATP-binding protein